MSGWRIAAVVVLVLCACGPNRRSVRTWIERDMRCNEVDITHIEFYHFEAAGCEERVVYHCPNRSACERESRRGSDGHETADNLDPPG